MPTLVEIEILYSDSGIGQTDILAQKIVHLEIERIDFVVSANRYFKPLEFSFNRR